MSQGEVEEIAVTGQDEPASAVVAETAPAPLPVVPPRPLTDFGAAIGFLTLLPCGRAWPEGRMPRSVGWYAWVGWLLASFVVAPLSLAIQYLGTPDIARSLLYGVLVVAAWALLTRFLHWDGLADTVDGIWGGSTPERRLEIMRDSRIGAFGAISIVLSALIQVAAVTVLVSRGVVWPLIVAPVVARFSISMAAWELPAARKEGLGLTAMGRAGLYERILVASAVLALTVCLAIGATPQRFMLVAGAGIVAGMGVPRVLSKQVGGMTGDLFGATVLLVETVVLVMGAVM